MNPASVNYAGAAVATGVAFLIGGLWYSPLLFGRAWMTERGLTEAELQKGNAGRTYGAAIVLTLIMAVNLAFFLADGKPDLVWGVVAGALAGVGWVATALGVTYVFERRSLRLYLIDAGYHAVAFMVMGGILGIWK
jgi:hypothetical protein